MHSRVGSHVFLLLLFCLFSARSARADFVPEFYSEAVTLDESQGHSLEANARVLWRKHKKLTPYAGFTFLRYSTGGNSLERKSPLLGIRWQVAPFLRAFAEYRLAFDSPESRRKKDDPRIGLILGHWQDITQLRPALRIASDSYAEIVFMNRYSNSPMAAGWSKMLLRWNPTSTTFADVYTEAYALESRDPALGRKSQELRYGTRVGWVGDRISVTALAFRRFASFVDAPKARMRFLLAIGGNF